MSEKQGERARVGVAIQDDRGSVTGKKIGELAMAGGLPFAVLPRGKKLLKSGAYDRRQGSVRGIMQNGVNPLHREIPAFSVLDQAGDLKLPTHQNVRRVNEEVTEVPK